MDSIEAPRIRIHNYCLLSTLKLMVTRSTINCRHMLPLSIVLEVQMARCEVVLVEGKHSASHQHSGEVDPS